MPLKFNQLPPTAGTTEVDTAAIRWLAYRVSDDRCINGVAEVCAAMVLASSTEPDEVRAIGEKVGAAIEQDSTFRDPEGDAECFVYQYNRVVGALTSLVVPMNAVAPQQQ